MKIARWMRQLPRPDGNGDTGPLIEAHLFKVSPPMEWPDTVDFKNGRQMKSQIFRNRRSRRNRIRKLTRRLKQPRFPGPPKYRYRMKTRTTAFVVVSASDLATYMEKVRQRMMEKAKTEGNTAAYELFQKDNPFPVETFIFPANKFGEVKAFHEMEGSMKGTLDHRRVIAESGYTLVGFPQRLIPREESIEAKIEQALIQKQNEQLPEQKT